MPSAVLLDLLEFQLLAHVFSSGLLHQHSQSLLELAGILTFLLLPLEPLLLEFALPLLPVGPVMRVPVGVVDLVELVIDVVLVNGLEDPSGGRMAEVGVADPRLHVISEDV